MAMLELGEIAKKNGHTNGVFGGKANKGKPKSKAHNEAVSRALKTQICQWLDGEKGKRHKRKRGAVGELDYPPASRADAVMAPVGSNPTSPTKVL